MSRFFFIIALFVILLSACRSSRQIVQQVKSDSTSVSFRDVEKIVHVPGDTVRAGMQVQLDRSVTQGRHIGLPQQGSPYFVPQSETIETDRTKVSIELTKTGEIKATAVSKDLEEKVTVQEKTITKSKNEVTVVQKKESWFKTTLNSFWKSIKTILITVLIVAVIATAIKLGFNPISFIKNLFKTS